MSQRCRAYALSSEPLGTPLSTPRGNPDISFPALGLPVYSSSEDTCSDLIAIAAQKASVDFLAEVARCEDYANPELAPVVKENLGIVGEEEEEEGGEGVYCRKALGLGAGEKDWRSFEDHTCHTTKIYKSQPYCIYI